MQHRAKKQLWIFTIAVLTLLIIITTTSLLLKKTKQATLLIYTPHLKQNKLTKSQTPNIPWQNLIVKPGDNLETMLRRDYINPNDIKKIIALKNAQLNALRPNQRIQIQKNKKGELIALRYAYTLASTLLITKNDHNFSVAESHKPITTGLLFKSGTIHHSLATAVKNAGLSPQMFSQLKHLFQGSINFSHDLRRGDSFSILYQEYYVNDQAYHSGNILAAEFINHGTTYKAVRFTYPRNHTGYFTPDGHGVEPLFLSAPVKYKRISSRFSYHRFDPYLHKWHTHLGVDFAAYENTPIHSIGDGRIVFIGRDAGYGNAIKIRYGRHYEALYAHMHRFAKVKLHQYVHRGQIIGYVGETGWATGPHLHFGFYIDGIPKNWLKIKKPHAKSIPRLYAKRFKTSSENLLKTLALYQTTLNQNREKHHG